MMSLSEVPGEPQSIQGLSLRVLRLKEIQIGVPLVSNHLAASEAPDGHNHDSCMPTPKQSSGMFSGVCLDLSQVRQQPHLSHLPSESECKWEK